MKKLFVGGVKPVEASDITVMLEAGAGWGSIIKAIEHKDLAHISADKYDARADQELVKAFPAHTVVVEGREVPTLTMLIYVPGLARVAPIIEGLQEYSWKALKDENFIPNEFTTVVAPERLRPANDIWSHDNAWHATFDLLSRGRSVVSTATNLRRKYLGNVILYSAFPAERIRVVVLKLRSEVERETFNGATLRIASPNAMKAQVKLYNELVPRLKKEGIDDSRVSIYY